MAAYGAPMHAETSSPRSALVCIALSLSLSAATLAACTASPEPDALAAPKTAASPLPPSNAPAATIAAAAEPLQLQTAQAPSTTPVSQEQPRQEPRQGMRQDKARELIDRIRPMLNRKVSDLEYEANPAGHRIVDLQGRFHHALVVRAAPDGSLHYGCANSGEQAEQLLAPPHNVETAP